MAEGTTLGCGDAIGVDDAVAVVVEVDIALCVELGFVQPAMTVTAIRASTTRVKVFFGRVKNSENICLLIEIHHHVDARVVAKPINSQFLKVSNCMSL